MNHLLTLLRPEAREDTKSAEGSFAEVKGHSTVTREGMGSNRRRIAMGNRECLRGGSLASRSASKALRLAGEVRQGP